MKQATNSIHMVLFLFIILNINHSVSSKIVFLNEDADKWEKNLSSEKKVEKRKIYNCITKNENSGIECSSYSNRKRDDRSQHKLKDFIKKSFQKQIGKIKLAKLKDLLTMRY